MGLGLALLFILGIDLGSIHQKQQIIEDKSFCYTEGSADKEVCYRLVLDSVNTPNK